MITSSLVCLSTQQGELGEERTEKKGNYWDSLKFMFFSLMTSCSLAHFLSIHLTLASFQAPLLFWDRFQFLSLTVNTYTF